VPGIDRIHQLYLRDFLSPLPNSLKLPSRLYTPFVTTDLRDYALGSTAIITASSFAAGSTVTLEVDHAVGAGADSVWGTSDDVLDTDTGEGHEPRSVTDGAAGDLDGQVNGSVTTSWYVNPDDSAGATFLLTAASADADGVLGTDTPLSYALSSNASGLLALSSGGVALVYSVLGDTLTAKAGDRVTAYPPKVRGRPSCIDLKFNPVPPRRSWAVLFCW
jgi:hypothetical protein